MEIEDEKKEFLFSLAGHKGETVETLGRKTESDLMDFAELLLEDLNRNAKENGRRTD